MANYVHHHTLYNYYRPLGAACIFATCDNGKYGLYMVTNDGSFKGYFGVSNGKGRQIAKSMLEKIDRSKTVKNCLKDIAKGIV